MHVTSLMEMACYPHVFSHGMYTTYYGLSKAKHHERSSNIPTNTLSHFSDLCSVHRTISRAFFVFLLLLHSHWLAFPTSTLLSVFFSRTQKEFCQRRYREVKTERCLQQMTDDKNETFAVPFLAVCTLKWEHLYLLWMGEFFFYFCVWLI